MDVAVDLRAKNPLYDGSSESMAQIFYPVVILPRWIPAEATHERERSIGLSFTVRRPVGTPAPLPLKPWAGPYRDFMREMNKRYSRASQQFVFQEWDAFMKEFLPTMPDSPSMPSDDIFDYVLKMGLRFQPPLVQYLYGNSPTGFITLRNRDSSHIESTTCEIDPWAGKRTWVDEIVHSIIRQEHQTIPHRQNPNPYRCWIHEFPEMLQGLILKVKNYNSETKKYDEVLKPGRIVAFAKDDINHPPTYRVSIFNNENPLANKDYVDIEVEKEYYDARFRYRESNLDEVTGLDDKHDAAKVIAEARALRFAEEAAKRQVREDARVVREQAKAHKAAETAARVAANAAAAIEAGIAPVSLKRKKKLKAVAVPIPILKPVPEPVPAPLVEAVVVPVPVPIPIPMPEPVVMRKPKRKKDVLPSASAAMAPVSQVSNF